MTNKRPKSTKEGPEMMHLTQENELSAFFVSNSSKKKLEYYGVASRKNKSGTEDSYSFNDTIAGELNNLTKGVSPIEDDVSGLSVSTAIDLCQRAYWNVPIFRNTIDIQTEFSNSKLHFKGQDKKTNKFFKLWYDKIGGHALGERFFREWFRSGNIFFYRFTGDLTIKDYRQMSRANIDEQFVKKIPLKYVLLNPKDIRCVGNASFSESSYTKLLNSYELSRLKNPKTQEEKEFLNTLTPNARKEIDKGVNPSFPLSNENLIAIFCAKQDYEALAIPMYYPVLPDIDLKLEFKKAEKVIARTVDYAILLVTAGSQEREDRPDGAGIKANNTLLASLKSLFESESVGRVLVSDFSTKAQFVIPDLNKIFGSEKYKTVNEDIANGLMNIFWGDEKFANSMVKIKVFLERLNSAREAYVNMFLLPEMKSIAETLGFRSVPTPEFETVDLKDEIEYMKVYTRLAELNILTPEELFNAYETHNLPIKEHSIESQREYKKLRDGGLYQPLIGGQKKEEGRPDGTKAPQKTKKVSPIGASVESDESEGSERYSTTKLSETVASINDLSIEVEKAYKQKHNLQRISKKHKDSAWFATQSIVLNEASDKWKDNIESYINNSFSDTQQYDDICMLAARHDLDVNTAAILFHSRISDN